MDEITFHVREALEFFGEIAKQHAVRAYESGVQDLVQVQYYIMKTRKITRLAIRSAFDWGFHELTKDVLRLVTIHYEYAFIKEWERLNTQYKIHIDRYSNKPKAVSKLDN